MHTERGLWLRWTLGTAVGLALGSGLAEIASSMITEETGLRNLLFSLRWQVLVGLCVVAPTILMQYLVLRPFVPGATRWIWVTMTGATLGIAVGAFVGLAGVMVVLASSLGCLVTPWDACRSWIGALVFPAGGAAAGAVTGGGMGVLLRTRPWEWSQEWTKPLAGTWAASGAVFWALVTLLGEQPFTRSGLLDSTATSVSVLSAGVVGLAAGMVGGAVSARHFAQTVARLRRSAAEGAGVR